MGLDNKQAFFICSNENIVFEVDWNAAGLMGFDLMLWFGKGGQCSFLRDLWGYHC